MYEAHPIANVFPMISDAEFEKLKADIEANGLKECGTLYEGKILDGRNRYKACQELGIEMDFCEVELGEPEDVAKFDPFAFVLSHNLHRRHLDKGQIDMVAAEMATLKKGDVRKQKSGPQHCGPQPSSVAEVAELFGRPERSIEKAKHVIEHAAKDVVEAVKSKQITLNAAEKLCKAEPDKKKQASIVKQGKPAVMSVIKESKAQSEPSLPPKDRAPKSVTQQCENEVNEFLLFWEQRTAKGKKAIWLWLVDNYDNA